MMRLPFLSSAPTPPTSIPATPPVSLPAAPANNNAPIITPGVASTDTVQLRKQMDNVPFVIEVNGQVTDASVQQCIRQLEQFERWYRNPDGTINQGRVKQKPILFKIDTPGGNVSSSFALFDKIDVLKKAGVTIEMSVHGVAASLGAYLLAQGSKGHRYANPHSSIMLHQLVLSSAQPTKNYVSEASRDIKYAQWLNTTAFKFLKNNLSSSISDKDLKELIRENYYMTAEEAKDIGLVDHIGFPTIKGFDEAK